MAAIEKFDSSMIVIREPAVVPVLKQVLQIWRQTQEV